jgi:Histidine kinase-like ATPase domain
MDARGSCQDRLESSGSGDVQPTQRPSPVPHPRRRGAQVAISPSHHGHDLEHWPLHDAFTLEALADAVPLARAHLRQLLSSWGRTELSPDASVVVSELVTNAVAASRERRLAAVPVLVWLGSTSYCLLLAVADASPPPPVRLDLGADAEGGRGLALVEALSSRWGWHPASITGLKKVVWAEWRLPVGVGRPQATGVSVSRRCDLAEGETVQGSPVPDPSRSHDVSGLTDAELERTRRDLQASLALARPGSTACVPMLAHLSAVESELAKRSAGRPE